MVIRYWHICDSDPKFRLGRPVNVDNIESRGNKFIIKHAFAITNNLDKMLSKNDYIHICRIVKE